MTPEDSLKSWLSRVQELEEGLEEAIRVITALRDRAEWSTQQKEQINQRIDKLTNIMVPF